jgi:iron complex outermembrane receptor protein
MNHHHYPPVRFAALASGLLFLQNIVSAQATAPVGPDASDKKTVELSRFLVTTSGDVGYLAQNSVSGSRLSTNLGDLATPVTAYTQEFLQDIGSTSVDELSTYMVSTQTNHAESNQLFVGNDSVQLRIRGLPAFNYSVNFFQTQLRLDHYNTERIEQSRGPNSILFGLGSPGGIINVSTKRASADRGSAEVAVRLKSNDGWRTTLDANLPLVSKRLAMRVAAVQDEKNTWRQHEYDKQRRLFLTGRWLASPTTIIDGEIERGLVSKSYIQPSVAADAYTLWAAAGKAINDTPNAAQGISRISTVNYLVFDTSTGVLNNLRNKTTSSPVTIEGVQAYLADFSLIPKDVATHAGVAFPQDTDYIRASAFLTHAFTPELNVELAANTNSSDQYAIIGRGYNILRVDTSATLSNGQPNPNAGRTYLEGVPGSSYQYDRADALRASGAFTKDLGKWGRHQIALLGEMEWSKRRSGQTAPYIVNNPLSTASPENAQNAIRFRTYVDLKGPAELITAGDWRRFDLTSMVDPLSGRVMGGRFINNIAGSARNRFVRRSGMAILQSRFLSDRLIAVAGYRLDDQDAWYSTNGTRGMPFNGFVLGEYTVFPGQTKVPNKAENFTYSGVGKVAKWFSVIYNNSRNSSLPTNNAAVATLTGRPPAPRGTSQDFGVKFDLGKRLYATAVYFETTAKKDFVAFAGGPETNYNLVWTALGGAGITSPNGVPAANMLTLTNGYTFDTASNGYEFELIANPTVRWRIFLNYSDSKQVRTSIGEEGRAYLAQYKDYWLQADRGRLLVDGSGNRAVVADDGDTVVETVAEAIAAAERDISSLYILPDGERARGQMRRKFNLRTNFAFDKGVLKKFSIGGGLRYQTGEVTSYVASANSSGTVTTSVRYGRANALVDLNLGYLAKFKWLGRNSRWNIQLNVTNVLDETQILPMRVSSTGQLINYRVQPPRDFMLTNRISF